MFLIILFLYLFVLLSYSSWPANVLHKAISRFSGFCFHKCFCMFYSYNSQNSVFYFSSYFIFFLIAKYSYNLPIYSVTNSLVDYRVNYSEGEVKLNELIVDYLLNMEWFLKYSLSIFIKILNKIDIESIRLETIF